MADHRLGSSRLSRRGATFVLLMLLVAAALLRGYDLRSPWTSSEPGWLGARNAIIGRNFGRETGAPLHAPVESVAGLKAVPGDYYLNHPALVPALVGVSFAVLGPSEAAARLVPLVFSVVAVFLIYRLSRRAWPREHALLAAFFLAAMPLAAYNGALVDVQGSVLLAAALLTTERYFAWRQRGSTAALAASLAAGTVACLADWPGFLLLGWIFLHHLLTMRFRLRSAAVAYPALALALAAAYVVWAWSLTGELVPAKLQRGLNNEVHSHGGVGALLTSDNLGVWMRLLGERYWAQLTPPVIGLALVGLAVVRRGAGMVVILLGFAVMYILAFPLGSAAHDCWSIYLAASGALAAACGTRALSSLFPRRAAAVLTVVLLGASAVWCTERTVHLFGRKQPVTYHQRLAEVLRRSTQPTDITLVLGSKYDAMFLGWYADRCVRVTQPAGPAFNMAEFAANGRTFAYAVMPTGAATEHPFMGDDAAFQQLVQVLGRYFEAAGLGRETGGFLLVPFDEWMRAQK